jgi:glycosyltransferase involved in cell wall biosynthesis
MRCPEFYELPPPPKHKSGWPWTAESTPITASIESWPRITVVTPSFNQAEFVEATVRSVLLQGYPNLEYIIMDGGSSDGTVEIIRKYEPWLSYWRSERDGGQYDAINKGFNRSNGEIMAWLNSDDMYTLNCFWVVGSVFRTFGRKVNWITGVPVLWDSEGRLCRVDGLYKYCRRLIERGLYEGRALGWVQQESTFWRRELWDMAGGRLDINWKLAADFELWLRFSKFAELYSVRGLIGGFRRYENQKTSSKTGYYGEVDQILSIYRQDGLVSRIFRNRILKRSLRWAAKRMMGHQTFIEYSPEQHTWIMTK